MSARPAPRRDQRRPRDNRPQGKPDPAVPPSPPRRSVLSAEAREQARQLAQAAPPFSPEVLAQLAVVLAPMGQHLASRPPARARAA